MRCTAVDWQEPMVLQRKLRPSIARGNVQLDPQHAASKHTTAPINHTKPSPRKHSPDVATHARKQTSDCSLFIHRNKVPPPGVEPRHLTHPSTNRARRRVTSLMRPTPLPLRHAAIRACAVKIRNITLIYGGIAEIPASYRKSRLGTRWWRQVLNRRKFAIYKEILVKKSNANVRIFLPEPAK